MVDKKSADDLLDEPRAGFTTGSFADMQTPFTQQIDLLAVTGDEELELMCRANPAIVEAANVAYNLIYRFHSAYIAGRIAQLERFSVALEGKGRAEVVQSLQAGSGVPDSFYESQSAITRGFVDD